MTRSPPRQAEDAGASNASPPALVVMLGGLSGGSLESLVRRALEASALDSVETALATDRYGRTLLLTDTRPAEALPSGTEVEIDGDEDFHFGRRLADAVAEHHLGSTLYLGGGAGPLLQGDDFEALAGGIAGPDPACVTNNFYSADLFAVTPASLLAGLDPLPAADNGVPRRLREDCGVDVVELPRSTGTQMNIDSPGDLTALALTGSTGPRLAAVLAGEALDTERLAGAAMTFTDRDSEVLVAGRVSSRTWQYLERETACRVRLLAEERGMGAAGRDADGSASSLLGQLLASVGSQAFFGDLLPDLCDAAFIDIRPALIQLGLHASRADRFAADVGQAAMVEDDRLREIVEAANASPVPVVLGGHSLVSGGLMLLNDWAWEEHDRALGL
ncbi:MAG: hypothetical protein QF664_12465 [Dehalococcoidia bacterium]|nr:hypothetical protein [Dehalococcoidia bacterium]